ncbi:MAG: cell division protein ZapB [Bryobacteraceae bacterium]
MVPERKLDLLDNDSDSLSSLEDQIVKTVQLVARLRQEKEAALKDAAAARSEAARMSEELEGIRTERKQVRKRIEKLLGQIDQLSAG